MIKVRRSAYETALLLVLNALHYGEEKKRTVSRFRVGSGIIRRLSRRTNLREAFLDSIREELNELGWAMAVLPDGENFAIFQGDMAEKWAGLGIKRLKEEGFLQMSETELEAAFTELAGTEEDTSDEVS